MDNNTALEILKRDRAYVVKNAGRIHVEALDVAIKTMEKQIPKKPKMRHLKWCDGYNDGWCPNCDSYVQELEYDMHFCQACGQVLDWS